MGTFLKYTELQQMWVPRLWGCQGFSGGILLPPGIGLFQRWQEMSLVDLYRTHFRAHFFYWPHDVWTNRFFRHLDYVIFEQESQLSWGEICPDLQNVRSRAAQPAAE